MAGGSTDEYVRGGGGQAAPLYGYLLYHERFRQLYHVRGHAYSFRLRFLAVEPDSDLVRSRYASLGGIPVLVVSRYSDRD